MSHEGQRPCPQGGACDGLAFSDIRKVLTWDEHGNVLVKASHEIDDDAAYVISEIVQTIAPGHITLKTKLADKKGALDSLARYFKLFVDKVDVNAKMHHISEPLQVLFAPWEQEEEAE